MAYFSASASSCLGRLVGDRYAVCSVRCAVNYGATAEDSIEMFGAEAVNSNAFANARVTIQAAIRRMHDAGKSDEEIQTAMDTWKMGVAVSGGRVDPIQASLAKFKTMSPEEQEAYLGALREAAAQAQ